MDAPKMTPLSAAIRDDLKPWRTIAALKAAARNRPPTLRERFRAWLKRVIGRKA